MTRSRPAALIAALILGLAGTSAQAARFMTLQGAAEVGTQVEAADWDTASGFAASEFTAAAGWDGDGFCPPDACLESVSEVQTPGGDPRAVATLDLLDASGTRLELRASTRADADVGELGILSDAQGEVRVGTLVMVDESAEVDVTGRCAATMAAGETASSCVLVMLGLNLRLPVLLWAACGDGARSCAPRDVQRRVSMRGGVPYYILAITRATTSTTAASSASADAELVLTIAAPP